MSGSQSEVYLAQYWAGDPGSDRDWTIHETPAKRRGFSWPFQPSFEDGDPPFFRFIDAQVLARPI